MKKPWQIILQDLAQERQPAPNLWEQLSPEEKQFLDWVARDNDAVRISSFVERVDTEQAWKRLSQQVADLSPAPVRNMFPQWLRVAAIVMVPVLVAALAYMFWPGQNQQEIPLAQVAPTNHNRAALISVSGTTILGSEKADTNRRAPEELDVIANAGLIAEGMNTLEIPRGAEYKLKLPDGSEIWVNAETRLRFPGSFTGSATRDVYIDEGEAFFKVAKNEQQPFIVHAGKLQVQVLGTSFNVMNRGSDVQTSLVEGKVQLSVDSRYATALAPQQLAKFDVKTGDISKVDKDLNKETAWKNGWLQFDDQPLEEVMETIGRWYDMEVVFERDALKSMRFGGRLDKYKTLQNALSLLEKTQDLKFRIKGNAIYVR